MIKESLARSCLGIYFRFMNEVVILILVALISLAVFSHF